MADSDKDILITPNTGQTAKPKIEVTGADNATKAIEVNDDGSLTFNSTIQATTGSVANNDNNLVTGDAVYDYIEAQNFASSGASNFVVGDITGQSELTSGLQSTDELVLSDGGSLARMDISVLQSYMQSNLNFTTDTNTFRTVTAGGNTLGASETLAFTAGSNVTITESGGAVTIASTDTNTQLTLLDEDDMSSNSATAAASQQSIKAYVDSEVSGLVDSAPSALNTLNELAAALGDDASFSTTTATSLGNRLRVDVNTQGLTSTQQGNALTNLGITATLAEINILDDGLAASDIPNLAASKITSGTLGTARIPNLATSKITSGTFADARVAESNVTQHQAALSITESQISDLQSYLTAPRTVTAGGQTLANNETLAFTAGSNVTISESGGAVTIASTDTNTQLSQEQVEDYVNGLIVAGSNISKTYDDSAGTLTIAATDTNTQLTQEQVEDYVAGVVTAGSNVSVTYDDTAGTLTIASTDTNTQLSTEQVQDIAGPLVATGGTKTRIAVTYDDTNNNMDFVVDDMNFSVSDITGATALTSGLASTDEFVISDGGTLKRMDTSVLQTYMQNNLTFTTNTDTQLTNEQVQDIVGAMFETTNTESGITVTYQDTTGDIDLVVGTLNQDTTGNADTATLASTVTVSDSTANTNFPVVFHDESNGLLDDTGALRYNPSTGTLLVPNLNVAGTTTTVDTVTMEAANAIVFEGATSDAYETTLTITDPTDDRTITLPNASGTVAVSASGGIALSSAGDITANLSASHIPTITASKVTEISNLTAAEGAQLENIGTTTISAAQWGYLGAATGAITNTDTQLTDAEVVAALNSDLGGDIVFGNQTDDNVKYTGTISVGNVNAAGSADITAAGFSTMNGLFLGYGSGPGYIKTYNSSDNLELYAHSGSAHVKMLDLDAVNNKVIVGSDLEIGVTGTAGKAYLSVDAAGSYIGWNASGTDVTLAADDDLVLHADDSITFQSGAATKMTLLSSGNLGIGTTGPTTPLHVSKTLTGNDATTLAGAEVFRVDSIDDGSSSNGPGFQIRLESTNDHNGANYEKTILGDGGGQKVKNIFGNYGFHEYWLAGNADGKKPIAYLTADGSTSASGTQYGKFRLLSTATAWAANTYSPSGVTTALELNAGGDSYFNGGSVGIGTSSPGHLLEVVGDGANGEIVVNRTSGAEILLQAQSSTGVIGTSTNHDLAIKTNGSTRMQIENGGNVGIGTTSPSSKLHVSGNTTIYNGTSEAHLILRRNATGTDYGSAIKWQFGDSASSSSGHEYARITGNIQDSTDGSEDGYLTLQTSRDGTLTEAIRINKDGEVGIGTTSPDAPLHVEHSSGLIAKFGEGNVETQMTFADARAMIGYVGDSLMLQGGSGNKTVRFAVNNGTFGSGEVARFDIDGNFGIGTTSPSEALHVVGDIKATADLHAVKANIEASSGYGIIEIGGPSGAYIDMKNPFSDDYDLRFITTGTGGTIQTSGNADLGLNVGSGDVAITGNLTVSGSYNLANSDLPDLAVSDFAGSAIQLSSESFADNDTSLMTSAAINDRIESFGYTTMTNGANNRILTATGTDGINAESNLTYDGTTLSVTASGTSTTLLLESTDAGNADAPILELHRNSASPANGDDMGQILWSGEKSDSSKYSITKMFAEINTVDNSDRLMINIASSGGSGLQDYEYMRFDGGVRDVIFNEFGYDIDVRIEGDSDSALFFTDASSDRIGIGTTSPSVKLDVQGDTIVAGTLQGYKTSIKSVSSNTTLADADSGKTVYWTGGTLTLPATAEAGQQFVIINNTNGSATPSLGTSNSIATNWTAHAAMDDETARTYIAVAANTWIYIG